MKAHRLYVQEQIARDSRFKAKLVVADARLRLAVQLALLREKRGWSQRKLAELTGIKQPQIARIEKGQLPTLGTLWRLADALGAQIMLGPKHDVKLREVADFVSR